MLAPSPCRPWAKRRRLTDLYHKGHKVEGVFMHEQAAGIAQDGIDCTCEHAAHEPPLPPPDAKVSMDANGDGIQGDESNVGGK